MSNSLTTTIIAKLFICETDTFEINSLMCKYQSARRMAFNQIVKDKNSDRGKIESYIKERLPVLNSRYRRDAIMEAEGIISGQKELLPVYLENNERKLKKSKEKLEKYAEGVIKAKRPVEIVLSGIGRRIERLMEKKIELEEHIKNNTIPSIVFGGKKNLEKLQKEELSKEKWKELRSNSFYSRGDASKEGNLHTRLYYDELKDEFKIRLSIPVKGNRCNYIYCPVSVPKEARHRGKRELLISAIENSLPYSIRILRDNDTYEAHITLSEEVYGNYLYEIPVRAQKVAGLDINLDRIAVVLADRKGNFLKRKTFYCHELEYVRTNKRDYIIHKNIKEVFEWLKSEQVECIVIEDLKFKQDLDTNKKLNRIKSNFTYRKLYEAITRKALRSSIDIKLINPAYTSQIGQMKYYSYGLSRHESAAYVIARRGCGYSEKIPARIVKKIPVLIERLKTGLEGAKEAARKKLLTQVEVLKNWKNYSPIETKHKWKLWALISKLSANSYKALAFT
ncbi:MAG: IS200/IS605 family accessory protein TnpB-related protein [Candidatus Eremiobacterota bacterium]